MLNYEELTVDEIEEWQQMTCKECGTMMLLLPGNNITVGNTERCSCHIESSIIFTENDCENCDHGDKVTLFEVWEPIGEDENYRWFRAFCTWCDAERPDYIAA